MFTLYAYTSEREHMLHDYRQTEDEQAMFCSSRFRKKRLLLVDEIFSPRKLLMCPLMPMIRLAL